MHPTGQLRVDVKRIGERATAIVREAQNFGIKILHPVKSLAAPPVLKALATAGCGFDVSNLNEMQHVLAHIVGERTISMSSVALSAHEMVSLADACHAGRLQYVNLDSYGQMREWVRRGYGDVGARVNVNTAGWPSGAPVRAVSRFGVTYEQLGEAVQNASAAGSRITALHFQNASEQNTARSYCEALRRLSNLVPVLAPDVRAINLGGGQRMSSISEWRTLFGMLREINGEHEIFLEPGQAMTQNLVELHSTILDIKVTSIAIFVVLSIGTESRRWTQPRMPVWGPHPAAPSAPYVVVGPSCFEQDYLGRVDPQGGHEPPQIGDECILSGMNGYAVQLKNEFNGVKCTVSYDA